MIIYHETKKQFIQDVDYNEIHPKLVTAFKAKTGSVPADERVFDYEYGRFSIVLRNTSISDDVQVAIEYHISAAGRFRIDMMLIGNDATHDAVVIFELKAWETADSHDAPDMVFAPVGGGRVTQHPSVQASRYKGMIQRFNEDVRKQSVKLYSSSYLFNLHRRTPEPLEGTQYLKTLHDSPMFLAEDVDDLYRYIEKTVPKKPQQDVMYLLEHGKLVPAPELIERVSSMLDGNEEFDLVDEQNVAFQVILHAIRSSKNTGRHVFIIEGGPGTGKSVIAIRLLAALLKDKRMVFFVAPNRAFRQTILDKLTHRHHQYDEDGRVLFSSSWNYHTADYFRQPSNEILIVDEAHRLKSRAHMYKGKNMVEDMVRAARISVFFIDETQHVQWNDIGSVAAIREAAKVYKAKVHEPFTLTAQFRCNGSTGYINWLDDVLQIRETGNYEGWDKYEYDFRVFSDPAKLYNELKARNGRNKARLIAGYTWDWPNRGKTRSRGTEVTHVHAGNLELPWNYDGENWATAADGIDQVGCVHTSQGVEFDYVGVLIGRDLLYSGGRVIGVAENRAQTDVSLKGWKAELNRAGADANARQQVEDKVQHIIKGTYKVLLTRGRKGCYIWCEDEALGKYIVERVNILMKSTAILVA
jgi:uncharacterized protein